MIRLGYVGVSKTLDVTASTNLTYTEYLKQTDMSKLHTVIISNLEALEQLLNYNKRNGIKFFRLTSKLIPLATKDDVEFDYIYKYSKYYERLKLLCKGMRLDVHPDQFTVINSTKKDVVTNSFKILEYHYNILNALGIRKKLILIHVGSSVFGKEKSIQRFIKNFKLLPPYIQKCIAIENDDKVFNIKDCLYICKKLEIPFVLDYHHHICNNEGENIDDYLVDICNTWKNNNPKMHFSSPKSKLKKEFRSHHDFIDYKEFILFLEKLKKLPFNIDIMLEAKNKDEALFKLIRQLKYYTDYKIKDTTITL